MGVVGDEVVGPRMVGRYDLRLTASRSAAKTSAYIMHENTFIIAISYPREPAYVLWRFGKYEDSKMAVKKRKPRDWTNGDVREFKMLARKKTPAAKIAKLFERTEGAIRQKAIRMGMSLNSRGAKA